MIERIYRCNFCRDRFDPLALHGIHWTSNRPGEFVLAEPRNVETHICNACMETISKLFQAIQQKERQL
jgi:hypothetical protein